MKLRSSSEKCGLHERGAALVAALLLGFSLFVCVPLAALPQDEPSEPKAEASEAQPPSEEALPTEPSDQKDLKTYGVRNGTATYGRTEEIEKKKTADGEVETHRVRSPSYGGDPRVLYEREVRTKKLPDGTIEREQVLRNPDGSGRMMPIEIIREKVRTSGESTTIEREMLRQDASGNWRPLRKERVTQTGDEKDRRSVKEVRERDLAGDWKLVDRTVTSESETDTSRKARAVVQRPDVYGELADFEVREETSLKDGDKESTEVQVRRRDTQDTHHPKFFLVERTRTEQSKTADGKVTRKSVTESDLISQGASRNVTPGAPKVVEERTEEETTGADGSTRRTVTVKERGALSGEVRPGGQVVQETDSKGNVRQILLPSR